MTSKLKLLSTALLLPTLSTILILSGCGDTDTRDNDGDGLMNSEELQYGTDPDVVDTDSDSLTDFEEVITYLTDPLNPNSDGDCVNDGDEINNGTDPLIANTCYSISGNITGLTGTVVLQNNGGDDLTLSADSSFTFATELMNLQDYNVTVLTQPSGQTCIVSNGTGTVSGLIITDVQVICSVASGYSKIGSSGTALADQGLAYNVTGSEATSDKWDCVQDSSTNLMWEVKTDDDGLRDKDWGYMNNTAINTPTNWDPIIDGDYDNGTCQASSSNSDGITCDTEGYIADVNSAQLCGHADWRLPTKDELVGLLNCTYGVDCDWNNAPLIEQSYFPNALGRGYWSSSAYASFNSNAWVVSFVNGSVYNGSKYLSGHVRLVRGSQ